MFTTWLRMVTAFLIILNCASVGAEVVIKIATVAPKDSIWHNYLKEIDQRWNRASQGQVRLKIYAGTLGDEGDIMRRVRVGQLDAATISSNGLATIDKRTKALHIPLAFTSNAEMEFVHSGISKKVEPILEKKGFKVLSWGEAGWVYFFSKKPVKTLQDLKQLKLFIWSSSDSSDAEDLWQDFGVNTMSLSSTDIMPALQTGMITAYQAPPLIALANQWFPFSPYMTDLKWAPLTGATVVTQRAWAKVPSELREELEEIAYEDGLVLQQQVRDLEQQALDAMIKRGLTIVKLDDRDVREWNETVKRSYPKIRGAVVPSEMFDEVMRLRKEFRSMMTAKK